MESEDACNALQLPPRDKKKRKSNQNQMSKAKMPRLSKKQQRKLCRLQEEKEKKEKMVEVLESLQKYKLDEDSYALLHASGTRGQRESMRDKLRRALHYKRAKLKVPADIPLLRERILEEPVEEIDTELDVAVKAANEISFQVDTTEAKAPNALSSFSMKSLKGGELSCANGQDLALLHTRTKAADINQAGLGTKSLSAVCSDLSKATKCATDNDDAEREGSNSVASVLSWEPTRSLKENEDLDNDDSKERRKKERSVSRKQKKNKKSRKDLESSNMNMAGGGPSKSDVVQVGGVTKYSDSSKAEDGDVLDGVSNVVVHVWRPEEVSSAREKLPIIMMEQEIMEAIGESSVTIICGETGCGKTTQVPQFLYEAGFSSSACLERAGMIGVTQPRRVAVLATAKRVSYEMNLRLGQEVGFQVRHDKKVGKHSRIKFMTDGILLREVQSDFLLRKYSVIVLDEAHERSLNTDILIGMLSRVLPLRQSLYEEQCKTGKASIYPLKLVIMSATLLVEEFVGNRKLFPCAPPVIEVPARQFPVTTHFSAKTELADYVGKAYKKVCSIHRKLPPGGVLVFLTGQAEVHYLCKRLQRAFPLKQEGQRKPGKQPSDEDKDLKDISEAADGNYIEDDFFDEATMIEAWENNESKHDSSEESDLEFSETERMEEDMWDSKGDAGWSAENSICLKAIKEAFDTFSNMGQREESAEKPSMVEKQVEAKETGPLYVLPLYALLPAASQLKIFGDIPEGSRLVVVATNVAETSITIPGIRYVVDCGRVKEKVFEPASGITRYEIGWISKASAAQRAGRSGRTGPGHCYRLYSSALFNDTFPDFSRPEIYRAPIESLVLLLKSMNIIKVNHFPFLSEPGKGDLVEAEKCLHALSALDANTGLLTPMGKAISLYPISPRHSRTLLTAMQFAGSDDVKDSSILLAYAGAVVAALSLDSPFATDISSMEDPSEEHVERSNHKSKNSERNDEALPIITQSKRSTKKVGPSKKYSHPLSDALGVVGALRAYETSDDPEEFCRENSLHARILYEMSKLRKQLIQIYLVFSKERGVDGVSFCDGLSVELVETAWKSGLNRELSMKHETVLRQAICAGWADRVAHKVRWQETSEGGEDGGEQRKHRRAIRYRICSTEESVYVHPSSSLRKNAPDFVVYKELVRTSRPYMKVVTGVDAHWLVTHGTALCVFSKPLSDPPPWYDHLSDDIYCWVSPSYGAHLWQLPLHKLRLKSKKQRIAVFACSFLQGKVLPSMKELYPHHLSADPSILLSPSGTLHKRCSELLHALDAASVDSRLALRQKWYTQANFLHGEILLWVQKNSQPLLERLWITLKQEAQQDESSHFTKKKKRQRV